MAATTPRPARSDAADARTTVASATCVTSWAKPARRTIRSTELAQKNSDASDDQCQSPTDQSTGLKALGGNRKEIEIHAGYYSDEKVIFKGIITCTGIKLNQNRPSVLTIECKDEAVKLTIGRKNKYFYESTDSDVVEEIAGAVVCH